MGTDSNPDLGHLSTEWSLVHLAHAGSPEEMASAQLELMDRYSGAVHRYLRGELRDRDEVSELDQEFAVRFLRGDFHRADPSRGRFRDFVKRSLRNLMIDHRRRSQARPRTMGDALPEPVDRSALESEFERRFAESWRAELLARSWEALGRFEERTGRPYHTLLRLRAENCSISTRELAARLSDLLGRPVSEGAARMTLGRARERLAGFLLDEVEASLRAPKPEDVEEELIALGLLGYCRPFLRRRGVERS